MSNLELSKTSYLTVYKASAGSGKTHQLTGEYIHLLFNYPTAYKHILAVTFTNKATEEMKSRIIEELANLATDRKSDYLSDLCQKFSKTEQWIRSFAHKILVNILHDYSSFSISTIDRFFQQTMRAFTREIGLGGGYNVELDTTKVLREAIDSMLFELERSENQQLLEWLIRFSEEKIENGETWNIRSDIQSLSTEIFKESYKAFSDDIQSDIANKSLLDDYKKMLLSSIRTFENHSKQIAIKALNVMNRYGLQPESFKNGSRSPFLSFAKWASGEIKDPTDTFKKLSGEIGNWYTKTTDELIKSAIEEAYSDGLNDCVYEIIALYDNSVLYQTAVEVNRYFFTLGILGDVDKKIRSYAAENNVMLISDTTELLNKIIQGTDTPFVYEKVGTRIDNYMIDEFQDTSGMQWTNFLPLLNDSISSGNKNLVVGDVKQSIYRWRNSDWKLLDEQLDVDFGVNNVVHKSLDTNWRSLTKVVEFNNAIFSSGPLLLQAHFNSDLEESHYQNSSLSTRIIKAYNNAYQDLPHTKKSAKDGYVKIDFIDTEEHTDWHEYVLTNLPSEIEKLQDRGYLLKDIAILVRTKKEGADVANALLEYKGKSISSKYRYDIISDEALFLRNANSVKLIISLFRYINNSSDISLRTMAIYEFYKLRNRLSSEETIQSHFSATHDFPADIKLHLERIRELPLYEMAEELFDLFSGAMDKNEYIYIQAFLDLVLEFSTGKSSDLGSFIEAWDESKHNQTIFTPDSQDAIRIMTIHKSKGLGFKAVIIPFCNWDIDHKQPVILWCQPNVPPFNQLKLLPVKYSQKLKNTIFAADYFDERLHTFIDNLNILYVAFTRAKENLIVFAPRPKDTTKLDSTSSLLWLSLLHHRIDLEKSFVDTQNMFDVDNGIFVSGSEFSVERESTSLALSDNEIVNESFPSIPFDNRLKLRLANKYFFSDKGKREYGNLMHEILSKVKSSDELNEIIRQYKLNGDITDSDAIQIAESLKTYLANPEIADWYAGRYKVLNEVQILQPGGSLVRPDRVMIDENVTIVVDYKFGEKELKKYQQQVKNYMTQIRKMGYNSIKGYLCYVTLGKIIEV